MTPYVITVLHGTRRVPCNTVITYGVIGMRVSRSREAKCLLTAIHRFTYFTVLYSVSYRLRAFQDVCVCVCKPETLKWRKGRRAR